MNDVDHTTIPKTGQADTVVRYVVKNHVRGINLIYSELRHVRKKALEVMDVEVFSIAVPEGKEYYVFNGHGDTIMLLSGDALTTASNSLIIQNEYFVYSTITKKHSYNFSRIFHLAIR